MLRIALLVLFPEGQKKTVTCDAGGDFLGQISALEINIEGMIPKNYQFFVNEINRGVLAKPSDLEYVICSVVWDIYWNSEAKSFSLSSRMHRTIFL